MQKGKLSRESVLRAVAECNAKGEEPFLAEYGYGKALDYVLVVDGREYHSKAVAGVAHKYEYGRALLHKEFSGGRTGAAAWLKAVGFTVKQVRNPAWTWDEAVLACALVVQNDWRGLPAEHEDVRTLSALLQTMTAHAAAPRGEAFRSPNSVARKTYDLATNRPGYAGKPTNAAKNDHEVIKAFLDDETGMLEVARRIRGLVAEPGFVPVSADDADTEEFEAREGRVIAREHLRRERDGKLKGQKIKAVLKAGGSLACEVCTFNFGAVYGERGAGYIECHHIVPLHVAGESTTRLSDLALICSNCHRMIHRQAPWPTPAQLRELLRTGEDAVESSS
ncbi:HNH endonuclease [Kitasatospora sp. NBC_01246]|uniref:HNH endonuclease n=1 Tax=Kitasatospora sp. NBC_01246 TaxID=2903570 RepID=UPI002E300558|nr:HNH endonuclease [Kitasatospora sp. NBC_01246]